MNFFLRVICFLGLFLGLAVLIPPSLQAADNFTTSYNVVYRVLENGDTEVRQEISITNLTEDFYASEHQFQVGSREISNVWAEDASGYLDPQVIERDENYVIQVAFGAPVFGRGNTYRFTLGYEVDAFRKQGNLWRMDIPGLAQGRGLSSYNLQLIVPQKFGSVAYLSPSPVQRSTIGNLFRFEFDKEQLVGGVRAGFGESQIYNLDLRFYLENPLDQKAYLDMPLPPDIFGRQQVFYKKLTPSPESIYIDEEGNYLARYLFQPNQEQTVQFSGSVYFYKTDRKEIFSSDLKVNDIPGEIKQKYTGEEKYWEVNSPEIKERAEKITSEDKSVVNNLKSIYEYTVAHLSYSEERLLNDFSRFGAKAALEMRNDVLCTEYADLFIALARSVGIPARLVEGYAYSESDKDEPRVKGALHAWVEVYIPTSDGGEWMQIDPTWGSTTGGADYFYELDLSHVAFVRKGISSTDPFLLADYEQSAGDWLNVSFGESFRGYHPNLKTDLEIKNTGLAGLWRSGILTVENETGVTAFDVQVTLDFDQLDLSIDRIGKNTKVLENTINVGNIPPWSGERIFFKLGSRPWEQTETPLVITTSWKDFSQVERTSGQKEQITFLPFWEYLASWYTLAFLGLILPLVGFLFWLRQQE